MNNEYDIYINEPYLSETNFHHLQNCMGCMKQKQYLAAAVWGAVLLEGFLGDLVKELDIKRDSFRDLNDYIQQILQTKQIPQEITNNFKKIQSLRNGLVHHTGYQKQTIETDAKTIFSSIEVILSWYKSNYPPKQVFRDTSDNDGIAGVPVFISTINPDNEKQKHFMQLLLNKLKQIGINPVRAELDDYDRNDPIGKIKSVIEECEAVLVIGLERSHAYFLRERAGSLKEEDKIHTKYTSGWLHLEAGIANALKKDMFVICQKDIYNDGIFDRSWNSYPVIEFNMDDKDMLNLPDFFNGKSHELEPFFKRVDKWVKEKL